MKLGTQNENTELLTFTSKAMPPGSGYDDDDVETKPYSRVPGSARKRKRILDDMVQMSNKQDQIKSELVSSMKCLAASAPPHNAFRPPPSRSSTLISEMNALTNQRNELRKIDDDSELIRKSISLTETALRERQSFCEDLMRTMS